MGSSSESSEVALSPLSDRCTVGKTTTLHVHRTFYTFLCRFCTTTTWNCLISLFMENVKKRRRNFILFLNLNMFLKNSTPATFAYIWQSKWAGIIAIKTKRTQIHFWSDIFAAVMSSDRKVPFDGAAHDSFRKTWNDNWHFITSTKTQYSFTDFAGELWKKRNTTPTWLQLNILSFCEKAWHKCRPIKARHLQKCDFKTKTKDRAASRLAMGL